MYWLPGAVSQSVILWGFSKTRMVSELKGHAEIGFLSHRATARSLLASQSISTPGEAHKSVPRDVPI
jgi:hypothetical protein